MGHPHLIRPPVCPSPLPTRKGSAPNPWCHPTLTLNHSVTLLHTSRLACFLHILHYPHLLLLPLIFLHKPPLLAPVICLLKICKHTMPLFRKYRIRRDPTWHKAVPAPHKIGILFLSVASTTLSQSFIVYDSLTLFHYNYFNSPIYLYYQIDTNMLSLQSSDILSLSKILFDSFVRKSTPMPPKHIHAPIGISSGLIAFQFFILFILLSHISKRQVPPHPVCLQHLYFPLSRFLHQFLQIFMSSLQILFQNILVFILYQLNLQHILTSPFSLLC